MKLETVKLDGKSYIVLPYPLAETLFTRTRNLLKDPNTKDKMSILALQFLRLSQDKGYFKQGNILCLTEIFSFIKATIDGNAEEIAKQEEFIF